MILKSFPLGAAVLTSLLLTPSYGSPEGFQFRAIDLRLLDEVNALDRQFEDRGFVYPDRQLTDYLQAIAERLLKGSRPPDRVQYHVRALRDPMVEAFGFPNGSIYVSTGMLATLRTEGQVATILGREIAHVADRHQYLENREARTKQIVASAAAAAASYFVTSYPLMLIQQSRAAPWVDGSGYTAGMEREADRDGLALTTAAGYDPQSAAHAYELLDEKLEVEPPATPYRSHDKLEQRIQSSPPSTSPAAPSEDDYLSHVANAVCYNIGADLGSRRTRTAVARAQLLVDWKPERPEYRVLLADAFRELGAETAEPTKEELSFGGTSDRRQLLRMTPEEEQAKLLSRPGGAAVKKANEATAEKLYLEAITQQSSLPAAYRGLGMLYQDQSRNAEAAREFRRYLELVPADAPDRLRIERRLDRLRAAKEH